MDASTIVKKLRFVQAPSEGERVGSGLSNYISLLQWDEELPVSNGTLHYLY